MRVAVLGTGRMGTAVAARLLERGHEVVVWNRSPGKTAAARAAGATECLDIAAAVKTTEIVMTCLATDEAVREVALGSAGVCAHLAGRLFIESSTISPALSAALAEHCDSLGQAFVAMPIAGSPDAVRGGEASYLIGGEANAVGRAKEVADVLSSTHHTYGSAALASVAKLTANALLLIGLVGLAEAVVVGRTGGLDDDELTELLATSPMLAPGVKNRLDAVMAADGPTWWSMTLGVKDVGLCLDVAAESGELLPAMLAVRERYQAAVDAGLADADIARVAAIYQG